MFTLDKFIHNEFIKPNLKLNEELKKLHTNPKKDPSYEKLGREIRKLSKDGKHYRHDKSKYKSIQKQIKEKNKKRLSMPSYIIKTFPKSIVYSIYADDWVLLITGSKKDSKEYKKKIQFFLKTELKLELDKKKP